jgi:siroheme synthase (precorrin-2 oxidase/ferrochelatase)
MMKQHIINNHLQYAVLQQRPNEDTARRVFVLADQGDAVNVRVADGPNSYRTLLMSPDVALAAYQWLGQWLQAQGVQLSVWTGGA